MNGWKWTLRNGAIVFLKNAVNALIVNVGAWWILPANFNLHNTAAMWNIAKLAGVTILSREAAVWLPVILKWSQTPTTELQAKLVVAQEATKEAVAASKVADGAITEAKAVAPPKP